MDRQALTRRPAAKNKTGLKQRGSNKRVACIIFFSVALFVSAGCDRYARYEALSFFFTGVPHPDSVTPSTEEAGRMTPEGLLKKRKEEVTIVSYAHGPYAAQQCYQCHSTSQSATFRFLGENKEKSAAKEGQNFSGRLVMPIKELCIDCHADKSVDSAFGRGLWIHGPVSEGICIVCHSPHASPFQYMLRKRSSREMCSSCHTSGFIMKTEDHLKDEECTSCHNPHLGKNRYLLKKDFNESSLN